MKRAIKLLLLAFGMMLLATGGCIALDQIPYSRAKPPKSVVDVASCLAWLEQPISAYRVTVGDKIYYLITGPAGRYLPSGTSAYAFDSSGKFIGWTPDEGDIHNPPAVFVEGAKDEKISLYELKKIFKL